MPDMVQQVETIFTVADKATKPLQSMAAAAFRVSNMFDNASRLVGTFGSVAAIAGGAFSVGKTITGTISFLDNVRKIQKTTGMAADDAGGYLDIMSDVGVESNEAVSSLQRMSMAAGRMNLNMRGSHAGLTGVRNMYQQLGLAGKTPVQQFTHLAKLAQAHKVDANTLRMVYRLMPNQAGKLMDVLAKGPKHIHDQVEEFKKLGIATQSNVEMVHQIKLAQNRVKGAWEKIQLIVGVQLLPIVARLLEITEKKLSGWLEHAQSFGAVLRDIVLKHMDKILMAAKLLLINFTLLKATGSGIGGWMGAAGRGITRAVKGVGMRMGAASAASEMGMAAPAVGAGLPVILAIGAAIALMAATTVVWQKNLENIQERVGYLFERMRAHLQPIKDTIMRIIQPLSRMFGMSGPISIGRFFGVLLARFLIGLVRTFETLMQTSRVFARLVGMVFDAFVGAWASLFSFVKSFWGEVRNLALAAWFSIKSAFNDNVRYPILEAWLALREMFHSDFESPVSRAWQNLRNYALAVWFKVKEIFAVITDKLRPILKPIGMWAKEAGSAVKNVVVAAAETYGDVMSAPARAIANEWREVEAEIALAVTQRRMQLTAEEAARKRKDATDRALKEKEEKVFDFRNSRFDIQQRFAEGFDPDRVAVAFTNDLASLADRKLQSGFSPVFAIR